MAVTVVCPISPPGPLVDYVTCPNIIICPLFTNVTLTGSSISVSVALHDTGQPAIPFPGGSAITSSSRKGPTKPPIRSTVFGKPLGKVNYCEGPIQLQVGCFYLNNIILLVLESSTVSVISCGGNHGLMVRTCNPKFAGSSLSMGRSECIGGGSECTALSSTFKFSHFLNAFIQSDLQWGNT